MSGFRNANNYKDLDEWNSQGREQLHSLLEKVSKTLRTKSYDNFMIWFVKKMVILIIECNNISFQVDCILWDEEHDQYGYDLRSIPAHSPIIFVY